MNANSSRIKAGAVKAISSQTKDSQQNKLGDCFLSYLYIHLNETGTCRVH